MKKALCLYGKIGSSKGNIKSKNEVDLKPFLNGFNSLNLHFSKFDEFDIFIHNWDTEYEDLITKIYNPQKHKIEEQKQFEIPSHINEYDPSADPDQKFSIFKIYSRWYSAQQSILLKEQYEKENNFKYDLVVCSRFDNIFNDQVDFDFEDFCEKNELYNVWSATVATHENPVTLTSFPTESPDLKNNCVVNGNVIKGIPRLQDNFIFSSSQNIDIAGNLFDNLSKYGEEDICYDFADSYAGGKKLTNHRLLPHHLAENNVRIALLNLYKRKDFNIYYIISQERKSAQLNPKTKWAKDYYKSVF